MEPVLGVYLSICARCCEHCIGRAIFDARMFFFNKTQTISIHSSFFTAKAAARIRSKAIARHTNVDAAFVQQQYLVFGVNRINLRPL